MRSYPTDKYDQKELAKLNAKDWQIELLKKNPSYPHWGNGEDYMSKEGSGWDACVNLSTWGEHWQLDEYNELVNFYFEVYRKNHECPHCEGTGQNPATKQLADDWYDFANTGRRWCSKITDVEVEALVKGGRLRDLMDVNCFYDEEIGKWIGWINGEKQEIEKPVFPTAEAVNRWNDGKGIGHDAINRWICVDARAKHLGVYGHCEHCVDGRIYDEPEARVALQLWMLHPRKGCSRGVYIETIEEHELPEVFAYLKEAAQRNADRFAKI